MFKPIPTMPALRAFEAAARLGSFTAAAEELGVTQGAISQHVKTLEKSSNLSLFMRMSRGVVTIPEGRRAVEAVRDGLERISGALGPGASERALTVSVLPGFAVKWLFPRLIKFDQRHPEIEVSISTSARLIDFASGEADISIRYGRGGYPGLAVEYLLGDDMFPVCSPRLIEDGPPLCGVEDLGNHALLLDEIKEIDGISPGWASWCRQSGLRPPPMANHRHFGQSNMVIQAAIEGMGVALGRYSLAIDDLIAGHLVRPFGVTVPSGFAYYLVFPRGAMDRPKVKAFRDWLHAEAALAQPLLAPLR
jgi:LysR family glycine cleavage system transcriptional activator